MSITVSNCFQISNSPLNMSKSKQLFSFPKSCRFKSFDASSKTNYVFYDLPSAKEKRSAAFGYGTKFDFTKTGKNAPAPNTYNIRKNFIDRVKGPSFGVSRDNMKGQSITGNVSTVPGPGNYDIKASLSKIAFSLRPKTTDLVPGPGTYESLPTITKMGKYPIAKLKNSCATVFNPPNSKRFGFERDEKVPGPGHYKPKLEISPDGKYFLSKFESSRCRSFSVSKRRGSTASLRNQTPGPGTYRLPSEFGHYESAKKE